MDKPETDIREAADGYKAVLDALTNEEFTELGKLPRKERWEKIEAKRQEFRVAALLKEHTSAPKEHLYTPVAIPQSDPKHPYSTAPKTTQAPSVGRIVLFQEEGGPYPSIVTAVNGDESLELVTFGRNSVYFQHGRHQDANPQGGTQGTWIWPPRV